MRLDHIIVSIPKHFHPDIAHSMVRDEFPGDHREVEPPVPIPNTKVKHLLADGTAVRPWESRSLPGFFYFFTPPSFFSRMGGCFLLLIIFSSSAIMRSAISVRE